MLALFSMACPISVVGCIYKLLSKILTNRSREVLPLIISPYQGAFAHYRQILDGVLIASELIDSMKRDIEERVIFKIDLEKAIDRVDWNFVDYMLGRFRLCDKWRVWIKLTKECISSTSFSVLVWFAIKALSDFKMSETRGSSISFLIHNSRRSFGSSYKKAERLGIDYRS